MEPRPPYSDLPCPLGAVQSDAMAETLHRTAYLPPSPYFGMPTSPTRACHPDSTPICSRDQDVIVRFFNQHLVPEGELER